MAESKMNVTGLILLKESLVSTDKTGRQNMLSVLLYEVRKTEKKVKLLILQ